jgi:ABC-type polysaccharide transport system, permease component
MKNTVLSEKWRHLVRDRHLLVLFLPCILFFVIFKYIPMAGFIIAFQNYIVSKGIFGSEWVGFEHFISFINSPDFFVLLRNTFILGIYGLITFPLPIIFALMLNELKNDRFKKSVQTISYLPFFLSSVVVIGIAYNILSPNDGLVNQLLKSCGFDPIYFISDTRYFRLIYTGLNVWQYLGYNSIIFIAAISGVSQELYDSAEIDGCGRMGKVIHVTMPSILVTIAVMFILSVGSLISSVSLERALLLQTPATYEVSDVISTFVYRRGLRSMDLSYATAVDLFNSIISIILLLIANQFSKKVANTSIL